MPESLLHRMVRTRKWVRRRSGRQQSAMPGKEMFKSQVRVKLPLGGRYPLVERLSLGKSTLAAGARSPTSQRLHVEVPQVPSGIHDERRIRVQASVAPARQSPPARISPRVSPIPPRRVSDSIHRLHRKHLKSIRRFRDGRRREKARKFRDHCLFGRSRASTRADKLGWPWSIKDYTASCVIPSL